MQVYSKIFRTRRRSAASRRFVGSTRCLQSWPPAARGLPKIHTANLLGKICTSIGSAARLPALHLGSTLARISPQYELLLDTKTVR